MLINLFYDEVAKVKPAAVPPGGAGAEMCMFLPGLQYYFGEEKLLPVLVDPCTVIVFVLMGLSFRPYLPVLVGKHRSLPSLPLNDE